MSFMSDTGITDPARVGLTGSLRVAPNCSLYNSVMLWLYLKSCIFNNCIGFYKARIENF